MRMWYKSITTVYQIVEEGAVPSIRSKKAKKCLTNIIPHGINEYSEWCTIGASIVLDIKHFMRGKSHEQIYGS